MHLTKKDRLNIAVDSLIVDERVQRRKMLNKMTECIFNALAFLFSFSTIFFKTVARLEQPLNP